MIEATVQNNKTIEPVANRLTINVTSFHFRLQAVFCVGKLSYFQCQSSVLRRTWRQLHARTDHEFPSLARRPIPSTAGPAPFQAVWMSWRIRKPRRGTFAIRIAVAGRGQFAGGSTKPGRSASSVAGPDATTAGRRPPVSRLITNPTRQPDRSDAGIIH